MHKNSIKPKKMPPFCCTITLKINLKSPTIVAISIVAARAIFLYI